MSNKFKPNEFWIAFRLAYVPAIMGVYILELGKLLEVRLPIFSMVENRYDHYR